MSSGAERRTSGAFRRLFHRNAKPTSGSPAAGTPSPVAQVALLPDIPPSTKEKPAPGPVNAFLEKALASLSNPEDRDIIRKASPLASDMNGVLDASFIAASERKKRCEDESWTWKFGKRTVVVRNEADKVVRLLYKVKMVGNILANVDPIHVGLPWIGIRLLLETAMADSVQMGALLTGMALTLQLSGRLKVYFDFFQHLDPSPATAQFESALVKMYANLLGFFAVAIKTYEMSSGRRTMTAMWETSGIEDFESKCNELANRAEIEASNCDRELATSSRDEDARLWKQNREASLQSLNEINRIGENVVRLHEKFDLSKLVISARAIHSTHQANSKGCLPGTRSQLISDIKKWTDDSDGKQIFWLCGKAGTGKSAVSVTVAKHFQEQHRLGASFFFKKGESDRSDARLFFTTIAKQLVDVLPVGRAIASALDTNSNVCNESPRDQYEKLIFKPLLKLADDQLPSDTTVLVIDALDECVQRSDVKLILQLLKELTTRTPLRLRIFITSRPDAEFGFRDMDSSKSVHQDVHLEAVQADTIKPDLRIYLLDCFAKIKAERLDRRPPRPLPADWPIAEDIEALVDLANPLFIYASTVYLYLWKSRVATPQNRLEVLLRSRSTLRLGDPGGVYLPILDQMALDNFDGEDVAIEEFKMIVGPMIILADPLSINALAALIDVDPDGVALALGPLYSVLDLPPDLDEDRDTPIRALHLSFRDFLVDETVKDNRFHIDPVITHERLAQHCIDRLSRSGTLKYDLCSVRHPGVRRSSINQQQVNDHIREDVAYACRYWVVHVALSEEALDDHSRVFEFLKQHFLHWVEAISWLGEVSSVILELDTLQSRVIGHTGSRLRAFLRDARRFMLRNRDLADATPLQLYSSALIFAPAQSIVRQTFIDDEHYGKLPHSLPIVPTNWNAEIQRLEGHDESVGTVAFSPHGYLLASGSEDKSVRVWSATTGEVIQSFKHSGAVNAVAFSPEGQVVVSASTDMTIRLWSTKGNGEVMKVLEGHRDKIRAVTFSPSGNVVASGSEDNTLRLWNAITGELMFTLEHDDVVNDIAFSHSPDVQSLASACGDGIVRLWDIETEKVVHMLEGHHNSVRSVGFHPEGQLLASASDDRTIRIWSAITGQEIRVIEGHKGGVRSVAFSTGGQMLASGSDDKTVRLWDWTTGEVIQKLEGHDSGVNAVIVSLNERGRQLVASASDDKTVRIWDATNNEEASYKLEGHDTSVRAVTLSFNGDMAASASDDEVVCLWDTETGRVAHTLKGHMEGVNGTAFSPNGKMLASASSDTVRLWDTVTGELKSQLKGHANWVNAVVFSPDGQTIASASGDKTLRLWNLEGQLVHTIEGHDDWVNAVAFSSDGQMIASASDDKTVRLWSRNGEFIHQLEGHDHWVRGVAFSPNGQMLASASEDKTTRIWNTTSGKELHQITTIKPVRQMKFTDDNQSLITDLGTFDLVALSSSSESNTPTSSSTAPYPLSLDGHWLRYMGDEYLWLPHEYRGTCSANAHGQVLAIGQASGTVSFFRISPTETGR